MHTVCCIVPCTQKFPLISETNFEVQLTSETGSSGSGSGAGFGEPASPVPSPLLVSSQPDSLMTDETGCLVRMCATHKLNCYSRPQYHSCLPLITIGNIL